MPIPLLNEAISVLYQLVDDIAESEDPLEDEEVDVEQHSAKLKRILDYYW